jgi:hypothetical protein
VSEPPLTWASDHRIAAVREKGEELESILSAEKKKAEDLNNKLTFYGGAYSKLSNKLQGMVLVFPAML